LKIHIAYSDSCVRSQDERRFLTIQTLLVNEVYFARETRKNDLDLQVQFGLKNQN